MAPASGRTLPVPPFELRQRVGATTFPDQPIIERKLRKASWWAPDPLERFLRQGEELAELLEQHLPGDAPFAGRRVLDFGCGAGRLLRHLVDRVGPDGELHGVDIDAPSIAWVNAHLPVTAHVCAESPGLPYADDTFDVIYAYSVFTHLMADWAGWLLELRRVLVPGGMLFATVLGRETLAELGIVVPEAERVAMRVSGLGHDWDAGGPVAVHDEQWIAEHWGRGFEIVAHEPRATSPPWPHDVVVARATDSDLTEAQLLAPGTDEGPDGVALARTLMQEATAGTAAYEAQAAHLSARIGARRADLEPLVAQRLAELEARRAQLAQERAAILGSRSWQLSEPLRGRRRAPGGSGSTSGGTGST